MPNPIELGGEWKEVTAVWQDELIFMGKNLSGGRIEMGSSDGNVDLISPMELILLGLAGCTGIDVVSILGKKRQILEKFQIQVKGKRAEDHPRIYTEIEVVYHLWGEGINHKMVERAIELSEDKYCSASAILRKSTNIYSKYIIHAKDDDPE
jgi:putative redox protein